MLRFGGVAAIDIRLWNRVNSVVRQHLGFELHPGQQACGAAVTSPTIAEMDTGEGKTAAILYPAISFAARGRRVFIATANEYLADRDAGLAQPVLREFGLYASAVRGLMPPDEKRRLYEAPIVYGTIQTFGFDFLHDQLSRHDVREAEASHSVPLQPKLDVLIIDEADSILIDEASTPLVISRPTESLSPARQACFRWAAALVPQLQEGLDYAVVKGIGSAMTQSGRAKLLAGQLPEALNPLTQGELIHTLEICLDAARQFQRDQHYVVHDDEVRIVDEFTGRIGEGRKWSRGIHQAIEAREGVSITAPNAAAATITIHELVSRFQHVSGLTGTALEAAREFKQFFNLGVQRIPRNHPLKRIDRKPILLTNSQEKWDRIVELTTKQHHRGIPVLIGTRTVESSQSLAERLMDAKLPHRVLNAVNHREESEIVAQAGQRGRITVATNMAGRGTDIQIDNAVRALGGMLVIGAEPNLARRIDRQLAGRCGRQGDPGTWQPFAARDDELFEKAYRNRSRFHLPTRAASLIQHAQRIVEQNTFQARQALRDATFARNELLQSLGLDPITNPIPED